VSAIAVNRLLRRRCHRLALLALVVGMAGAFALHHLRPEGGMDMGDMAMDGAMVVCLAVVPAVAVAAAVAIGVLLARRALVALIDWPARRSVVTPPLPRARSNPVATVVLRR
jgi:hypothetical protein